MDMTLLALLLLLLLAVVILNLLLTVRLARQLQQLQQQRNDGEALPFTTKLEDAVPAFSGRRLLDGAEISSEAMRGTASVLVFLSASCGDCRKLLPQLATLLPAMQDAGVALVVIGLESENKVRRFLSETPLFPYVLLLDADARRLLNPRNSAPFYLFVDDQLIVKASHFVGDENWRAFVDQVSDAAAPSAHPTVNGEAVHEQ